MSNKGPSLGGISEPRQLDEVLAEQSSEFNDCMSCRVMGSTAFTLLGIYSYGSGMSQLRKREQQILRSGTRFGLQARKASVFATSAVLVGLGIYRLTN